MAGENPGEADGSRPGYSRTPWIVGVGGKELLVVVILAAVEVSFTILEIEDRRFECGRVHRHVGPRPCKQLRQRIDLVVETAIGKGQQLGPEFRKPRGVRG